MAAPTVISTINGKVYWTPYTSPPSAEVELDVKEISIDIDPSLQSAAGSKSAPFDRSVATLIKVSGNFQVYFKTDEQPFAAARSLKHGQYGSLRCPVGNGTEEWRFDIQIGKITEKPFSTEEVKINQIDFMGQGRIWYPGETYP